MSRLARANTVEGWMSPRELAWLEQAAYGIDLAIELGSWCGRSSVALASAKRLVCVDSWRGSANEPQHYAAADGFDAYAQFTANLADEIHAGIVETRRGDLSDDAFRTALRQEFGGRADLVFVDASHDEASVAADIALATTLLRPGGVLCGHDFSPIWPGVVAAVMRLVPNVRVATDSIWCSR